MNKFVGLVFILIAIIFIRVNYFDDISVVPEDLNNKNVELQNEKLITGIGGAKNSSELKVEIANGCNNHPSLYCLENKPLPDDTETVVYNILYSDAEHKASEKVDRKSLMHPFEKINWREYVDGYKKAVDKLNSTNIYNIALSNAIGLAAPQSIIRELINLGAVLDKSSITSLLVSGDRNTARDLIPYGLNFDVDWDGDSSIDVAVLLQTPTDLFMMVLDSGIMPAGKTDLLSLMLNRQGDNDAFYIEKIIYGGAVVTKKHLALLSSVKVKNPAFYNEISIHFT